jgi:hypothetical protein
MYRGGLDCSQLLETELGFDADALSKTFPKVKIDRIRGDVHQSACCKHSLKVFYTPVVRQIVTRTENSTIPRRDELNSTRTLNRESFAGRIYVAAARTLRME